MTLGRGSPTSQFYSYNANNQLEKVKSDGNDNWTFSHDVNGNLVSVTRDDAPKITLGTNSSKALRKEYVLKSYNIESGTYGVWKTLTSGNQMLPSN